jgi:hypothetical protein
MATRDHKQIAAWLLAIGGALGILKTIVEYAKSAVDHSNILLITFYNIGLYSIIFGVCLG